MQIELLWLIPILAFALLIFFIAFYFQHRAEKRIGQDKLSKQVDLFNAGRHTAPTKSLDPDTRIQELESTISSVAASLAHQQKSLQDIHKDSSMHAQEVSELKEKLRNVFKEYDILLSENYSLRAKVKQLLKKNPDQNSGTDPANDTSIPEPAPRPQVSNKSSMQFEDTRVIHRDLLGNSDL